MSAARATTPAGRWNRPPYLLCWGGADRPLPCRVVRGLARHGHGPPRPHEAPPWHGSGPAGEPFDFCAGIQALCADVIRRCPDLGHVRIEQVLFGVTQARNGRAHGLQARVTPLRFHGGELFRRHRGITYRVQRYRVHGHEILYLMTFCLPRFLDQDFDEKFVTLFHELYHISPQFDGDLRRHAGRYAVHTRSQRGYDEQMAHLARAYLADGADPKLHGFLRLNFAQLRHRHGHVLGTVVPRPKLIPVQLAPRQ
jgi:hypothetical protein